MKEEVKWKENIDSVWQFVGKQAVNGKCESLSYPEREKIFLKLNLKERHLGTCNISCLCDTHSSRFPFQDSQ